MSRLRERRLLILCTAAVRNGLNTWIKNNVDLQAGDQVLTVGLSASGNVPATHYWASGAWTEQDIGQMIRRLATLVSIALPNWSSMTRQQKIDWVQDNKAAIQSAVGIRFIVDDNQGAATDPQSLLTAAGLKVISPALTV